MNDLSTKLRFFPKPCEPLQIARASRKRGSIRLSRSLAATSRGQPMARRRPLAITAMFRKDKTPTGVRF
jgi:hypothetical protein